MAEHVERVEVEVDAATARWLRFCARRRGGTVAAAAAAQLHDMALVEAAAQNASLGEQYFLDVHAEQQAALAEAGLS